MPVKSCYLKYVSGKEVVKAQNGFGVPKHTNAIGRCNGAVIEHMAVLKRLLGYARLLRRS